MKKLSQWSIQEWGSLASILAIGLWIYDKHEARKAAERKALT